jgi:hypothetical protein
MMNKEQVKNGTTSHSALTLVVSGLGLPEEYYEFNVDIVKWLFSETNQSCLDIPLGYCSQAFKRFMNDLVNLDIVVADCTEPFCQIFMHPIRCDCFRYIDGTVFSVQGMNNSIGLRGHLGRVYEEKHFVPYTPENNLRKTIDCIKPIVPSVLGEIDSFIRTLNSMCGSFSSSGFPMPSPPTNTDTDAGEASSKFPETFIVWGGTPELALELNASWIDNLADRSQLYQAVVNRGVKRIVCPKSISNSTSPANFAKLKTKTFRHKIVDPNGDVWPMYK